MNINAINLNLLLAFDALYQERSVTRAARRLGLTQPALSNSLAQLRRLFSDQLFLRQRTGLLPTARASELAAPIRQGLSLLQSAVEPQRFDPRTSERRFRIAASDYVELVLLPRLLRRLAERAPRVRLALSPWGLHEAPPELARGELDLMLGFCNSVPAHHHQQALFTDEYVCVVRHAHPTVKGKLTLARYVQLSHVLVSTKPDSPGSVDRALAALGKSRHIGARVSHFSTVPVLVSQTDLVAALDRRVAETFAKPFRLQLLKPPLELPQGTISQVWHEQHDSDPSHAFLRELVTDVSRQL